MIQFGLFLATFLCHFDLGNGKICEKRAWSYLLNRYITEYEICSGGCCGSYENRSCCVNVGAIVGGTIGAIVFIGLIVSVAICMVAHFNQSLRRRNVVGTGVRVTTVNTEQGESVPPPQPMEPSSQTMGYGQPQPMLYGSGPHPMTSDNSDPAYLPSYPPPPPAKY